MDFFCIRVELKKKKWTTTQDNSEDVRTHAGVQSYTKF